MYIKHPENKDKNRFYVGLTLDPKRMKEFLESFQKIEDQINTKYIVLFKEYEKNGTIPPWNEMVKTNFNDKVPFELDLNILNYIDMLTYIKWNYEHHLEGKVITLRLEMEVADVFENLSDDEKRKLRPDLYK